MRLFVAVWPSAEVVETVRRLERPEVRRVRWTAEQQWHVTLRFLGSVDEAAVSDITAALETVGGDRVRLVMGPETACFGRNVLYVPVDGLGPLATSVIDATAHLGAPPEPRPFRGHLTLARSGNRRTRGPDLRAFAGVPCSGEWTASEFSLVRSRPHHDGVRYDVIHRTQLSRRA